MAKYALKPEYVKRIKTKPKYRQIVENVKPNLIKRNFNSTAPNKVWLTDILKKETLYNNYITSLEEYIDIVEDWLIFYNTQRLKNRKKS